MAIGNQARPAQQWAPRVRGVSNGNRRLRETGKGRETVPINFNPYAHGLMGIIPRRGVWDPMLFTKMWTDPDKFARTSHLTTMRLLSYLPDVHPGVGHAVNTMLRLTCGIDDLRIVAVKPSAPGAGDEQIDEEDTASLDALWQSLPNEIGGLQGLRTSLTLLTSFTGLTCLEAVPGEELTGVRRVWPVDSMTIVFARDNKDADLTPYQYQWYNFAPNDIGYKELNPLTFMWRAMDNWGDDPYGRAPYATTWGEVISDLPLMKDLRDALHHVAWPRLKIGFNFTETYKYAVDVVGIKDPIQAADWVQERFREVAEYAATLKADDAIVTDTNGTSDIIEGGKGLGNIPQILEFLRHRMVQACKSLPTLMGINDGSTQTYTSVEWAVYAATLETLRDIVNTLLVQTANLHLRLQGKTSKAIAKLKAIRTNDELVDANTENQKIINVIRKYLLGFISYEQACIEITGSGPASDKEPDPAILQQIASAAPPPQPQKPGQSDETPPQKPPEEDTSNG